MDALLNTNPGKAPDSEQMVVFRLYIVGGAPNSLRALANLRAICQTYLPGAHRIEVVDVLDEPFRALTDGVLVTPTVIKCAPAPGWRLIGDLSARIEMIAALLNTKQLP